MSICLFRFSLQTLLKSCYNVSLSAEPEKSVKNIFQYKPWTHYCKVHGIAQKSCSNGMKLPVQVQCFHRLETSDAI